MESTPEVTQKHAKPTPPSSKRRMAASFASQTELAGAQYSTPLERRLVDLVPPPITAPAHSSGYRGHCYTELAAGGESVTNGAGNVGLLLFSFLSL